jgi:hypothetical protein
MTLKFFIMFMVKTIILCVLFILLSYFIYYILLYIYGGVLEMWISIMNLLTANTVGRFYGGYMSVIVSFSDA